MNRKYQIILTAIFLVGAIVFFSLSDFNQTIQDHFFDVQTRKWVIDKDLQPYKFIFYDGIKKLLILFAISMLILVLFFKKNKYVQKYMRGLIVVVLSAIFVPLIVGELKKETNMPCPKDTIHYGGKYPETKVWESYPSSFTEKKIRCWPAGHASGGFALLSLLFLFKSRKIQIITFIVAMSIGWSMGIYKMLIGDHYFSHTFITMLLAWLIILIIETLASYVYFTTVDNSRKSIIKRLLNYVKSLPGMCK